eukprot:gene5253-6946_t
MPLPTSAGRGRLAVWKEGERRRQPAMSLADNDPDKGATRLHGADQSPIARRKSSRAVGFAHALSRIDRSATPMTATGGRSVRGRLTLMGARA